MPKEVTLTNAATRTQRFTISGYEVLVPIGFPRAKASAAIRIVEHLIEGGVVTVTKHHAVSVSGLMPDGVTGKLMVLLKDITDRQQVMVTGGTSWAQAYDQATADGMYAWVKTNHPEIIPAGAS